VAEVLFVAGEGLDRRLVVALVLCPDDRAAVEIPAREPVPRVLPPVDEELPPRGIDFVLLGAGAGGEGVEEQ
jgi:hypothetical protein